MNDNIENTPNTAPKGEFRITDFEEHCPDCAVAVGEAHVHDVYDGGCDVARCLVTGRQRLMCDLDHDCGQDTWSGWWPGHLDCQRLGWMLGPGFPDLKRLYTEATPTSAPGVRPHDHASNAEGLAAAEPISRESRRVTPTSYTEAREIGELHRG